MSKIQVGSIVRLNDHHTSMLTYGEDYKVVKICGNREVRVNPVNESRRWGKRGWGTRMSWLELSSECYKCIHACKMEKKCSLFEETE